MRIHHILTAAALLLPSALTASLTSQALCCAAEVFHANGLKSSTTIKLFHPSLAALEQFKETLDDDKELLLVYFPSERPALGACGA